jgi:N-methylhydantoinase A
MARKVRIGIDVGGTFTDAVAIDNDTYEIIASKKIPTTHKEGVAYGIVQIVREILKEGNIDPSEVNFIAHGTTQATNALLEGDVAHTGIIGMGTGTDARSAKRETNIPDIELSPGKYLRTSNTFLDTKNLSDDAINAAIDQLIADKSEVVVASAAYSVDDPKDEDRVAKILNERGILSTVGHEMSELYGLNMRTRTAVVNASLIPKMMATANMTEQAVKDTNIKSELMIMRADGGVMSIDEVRHRPILTMLSGLAAGVAGALMYEKITDGIFFETGGTSVDVSVIKNGKTMVKYAEVGGFKTYLRSLDVRTMGLAGGTMIQIADGKISDVGPRSAHIAGLAYECFDEAANMKSATAKLVSPCPGDPEYVVVFDQDGNEFSPTLCGAANLLGYIPKGDFAEGNRETARVAWDAVGKLVGMTAEEAAAKAMDIATDKLKVTVDSLIEDYNLNPNMITFIGGGGSAAVLAPALAKKYGENMKWRIAKNAPSISAIGVALAMVRETLERSVNNPTPDDIKRIRRDVIEKIVRSGAAEETVDVSIEIDSEHSILRAVATGATEFRAKNLSQKAMDPEEMRSIAAQAINMDTASVDAKCSCGRWTLFSGLNVTKKFFGLISTKKTPVAVVDREGVVRFKTENAHYLIYDAGKPKKFDDFLYDNTIFGDANATIPRVFLFYREKMLDLTGMQTAEQMKSIMEVELSALNPDDRVIAVAYN